MIPEVTVPVQLGLEVKGEQGCVGNAGGAVIVLAESRSVAVPDVPGIVLQVETDRVVQAQGRGEVQRQEEIVGRADYAAVVVKVPLPALQGGRPRHVVVGQRRYASQTQGLRGGPVPGRTGPGGRVGKRQGCVQAEPDRLVGTGLEHGPEAHGLAAVLVGHALEIPVEGRETVARPSRRGAEREGMVMAEAGTDTLACDGRGADSCVGVDLAAELVRGRHPGLYYDHAVRSTGPVKGRRGSVLQDFYALDVIEVPSFHLGDFRQIGIVAVLLERLARLARRGGKYGSVHYPQGLADSADGIQAPDAGADRARRVAVGGSHAHAADHALEKLGGVGEGAGAAAQGIGPDGFRIQAEGNGK